MTDEPTVQPTDERWWRVQDFMQHHGGCATERVIAHRGPCDCGYEAALEECRALERKLREALCHARVEDWHEPVPATTCETCSGHGEVRRSDRTPDAGGAGAMIEFWIPTLPKVALSPNGNKGGTWAGRHGATRELRGIAKIAVQSARNPPLAVYDRARIDVEYRHTGSKKHRDGHYRPRDIANAIAALKPVYDGIVDAGIIPDDSYDHMELGPHRIVRVERYEDEGLAVTIEELD